jgi:hypothetical protein
MTLSDAGFYFQYVAWGVAALIAIWAIAPLIAAEWRSWKRDVEKGEIDGYLDRLDPEYERTLEGNGTWVPLQRSDPRRTVDPWKKH